MGDVWRFLVFPLAAFFIVAFYFFPNAVENIIPSFLGLFGYYNY